MADAERDMKRLWRSYVPPAIVVTVGISIMASSSDDRYWMLIVGLIAVFYGLVFGMPLAWLRSSAMRRRLGTAVAVHGMDRIPLQMLAESTGSDDAAGDAIWCIQHGYLDGYIVGGGEVVRAELADPSKAQHAATCPNCHASFTYSGDMGRCPYCGDYYERPRRPPPLNIY